MAASPAALSRSCCSRYKRGIPFLSLGDITCAVGPIGLFLGRIANFINGELWGRPADVPWAMIFPGGGPLPRHPSQLYEAALEGLLLLVVLALLMRARRAQAAWPDHWHLCRLLCAGTHILRILSRAGRATRFSVGRCHDGTIAVGATVSRWRRLHRLRTETSAAPEPTNGRTFAAGERNSPPHCSCGTDASCRIHGAVPVRSRSRLLHHARSVRRTRRFHHRAGSQPDVRRTDRPLDGRRSGSRWARPRTCG